MPGFAHFELVELIHDDVANTWLAREPGSGRLLLLHKFSRASGLREKIRAMNPPDLGMLIKAGEESGLFYVVTYDTPELRQFRRWVESRSKVKSSSIYPPSVNHSDPAKTGLWRPPASASSEAPPQAPEPKESASGEFTQMFQAPPAAAPSSEPGTFTRMFEPPAPAASNTPAPKEPAADEFTRMFQAPLAEPDALSRTVEAQPQSPLPANSNSPAPTGSAPGEFTRMFQAPPAEPPPRQPIEPELQAADSDDTPTMEIPVFTEAPAAPSQPAPSEPGSFTRMFQQPQATQPDSAAATKRDEPSTFTRMFNTPGAQPSATENRPAQPEPPPQPAASEPGSFTRMFQQPSGRNPAPSPPPPARLPNNSSSGDFTRFFNSPMQATPLAENLNSAPASPPEPAPRDPGSFTRMFGAPGSSRVPEPPSSNASSAATGVFSNRQAPSGSAPPPSSGPGEYTRLFSAPAATQDSGAQPPAPAPDAAPSPAQSMKLEAKAPTLPASPAAPKNYIWLVVVLALLAVVAIALILYFALRR